MIDHVRRLYEASVVRPGDYRERVHAGLEAVRDTRELRSAVEDYALHFATNSWDVGSDTDLVRVPREWQATQPERYDRVMRELDEKARHVVVKYDALLDRARRVHVLL